MKKTILFLSLVILAGGAFAQKKTTTSAIVSFDATTPKDALPKADNNTVIAAVDTKAGTVAFEATVKNFAFSNAKIQEHFNGLQWLDSDNFPKFSYKGKIDDLSKIKFNKDGSYDITVTGDMTIKSVTKPVTVPATIVVKNGAMSATAEFSIVLADYGISGAPIEGGKVAKEPKVKVTAEFN